MQVIIHVVITLSTARKIQMKQVPMNVVCAASGTGEILVWVECLVACLLRVRYGTVRVEESTVSRRDCYYFVLLAQITVVFVSLARVLHAATHCMFISCACMRIQKIKRGGCF